VPIRFDLQVLGGGATAPGAENSGVLVNSAARYGEAPAVGELTEAVRRRLLGVEPGPVSSLAPCRVLARRGIPCRVM